MIVDMIVEKAKQPLVLDHVGMLYSYLVTFILGYAKPVLCFVLSVLDCSWHMPIAKRNARREFTQSHIPGAQFFDIDECCDKSSEYDHMLPQKEEFEEYVGKMGVGNHIHVVVYDNNANFGLFSAPRVWWMFRMYGHSSVSVLDGGFPKWIEKEYGTTDERADLPPQTFKAFPNNDFVKSYDDMLENLTKKSFAVVDARSAGRFEGTAPEPRPGTLFHINTTRFLVFLSIYMYANSIMSILCADIYVCPCFTSIVHL